MCRVGSIQKSEGKGRDGMNVVSDAVRQTAIVVAYYKSTRNKLFDFFGERRDIEKREVLL